MEQTITTRRLPVARVPQSVVVAVVHFIGHYLGHISPDLRGLWQVSGERKEENRYVTNNYNPFNVMREIERE